MPDFVQLARLNQELNAATTHLFTFDASGLKDGSEYDLYTCDFAPAVGVTEDPVTGSANGALAGYLVTEQILNPNESHRLKIAQGHSVGRPGTLLVTITPGTEGPVIQVGGSAVITVSGQLNLKEISDL